MVKRQTFRFIWMTLVLAFLFLPESSIAQVTPGGGVSSVATACGLTGGTITTTGTVKASEVQNAQTGTTYTVVDGDCGKLLTLSNAAAVAVTLPQANGSTFVSGWFVDVVNLGVGTVTITPTTSTINGAATLALTTNQGVRIVSNGTNYFSVRGVGSTYTAGTGLTLTGSAFSANPAVVGFLGTANTWSALQTMTGTNFTGIPPAAVTGTAAILGANTFTGRQDATGASSTAPMKSGTSLPGTCTVSDLFFKTDATAGQNIYQCQSTNVWTQQLNSAYTAGTGLTLTGSAFSANPAVVGFLGTANTWSALQTMTGTNFTGIPTAGLVANAVTSAKMAVVNTRGVCDIGIGDTSGSALTNAQLGPQKRGCFIPAAATVVEVDVSADAGTPSVIVGRNVAGTQANILSGALATAASGGIACSKTTAVTGIDGATTCSATLQNTALAAGSYLELVSGTAGGTAKWMTVHVVYVVD